MKTLTTNAMNIRVRETLESDTKTLGRIGLNKEVVVEDEKFGHGYRRIAEGKFKGGYIHDEWLNKK